MLANRVQETTTSTGTGNLTLAGAVANHQTINNGIGTDVRFPYFVIDDTNSAWEHGVGYLSDATTLVRETVIESTNSNATVNFSAGTKQVFVGGSALTLVAANVGYSSLGSQLKYQAPLSHVRINNTYQLAANRAHWVPVYFSRGTLINQIACYVVTANGTGANKLHIGLYQEGATPGEPGPKIASVADLDPSTTGLKSGSVTEFYMPAGWYYFFCWSDATPTLRANDAFITAPTGVCTDPLLTNNSGLFYINGQTGLLDAPDTANHADFSKSQPQPTPLVGHS